MDIQPEHNKIAKKEKDNFCWLMNLQILRICHYGPK